MGQGVPTSRARSGTAPPVSAGDILAGKYRVERVLGAGGMGVVVAATHIDLLERRAIKFMLAAQLGDAEAVERFLREARASSRLKGEHVAKVHDVGRLENGAPYMVMEYLTGGDLRVLLKRRGAIPLHEAALYVLQACEALAEAHGAGIVHRDVKPENLFLTKRPDGTPSIKVLDFGISKVTGTAPDLAITTTQAILGSPYYMSPEQLRASRDVDARADVWSLGIILYQLVTNNLPFQGANLTALISNVLSAGYPPASLVKPDLAEAIDRVIARCLERDLARRYPSVADLAEDLLPFAPPVASQSVERILRLIRPSSSSASDLLSLYEAPRDRQPSSAKLVEMTALPLGQIADGATTDRSPGPLLDGDLPGEAPAAASPLAISGSHGASGSTTNRASGTLRSSDASAARASQGSADWGNSVPSVRVVVEPSRAPLLILAAGGALALVIASVALLLGRSPARRDIVVTPSPAGSTATALSPVVTVAPQVGPGPGPSITLPSASAGPSASASARHLWGKLPTHPGASAEPTKPPPNAGDPFGEGRQ